ncbi:unnamed protein product [Nyctereutes procyonoides]|uniref:(raccoon dog) hypothetical protein n=1 Tax=Nyctereutes procyonoides TaxID=34880 RepID=A0A811YLB8_NYCPR|nr:unnamed protein product [Nyctereutes procyonoides]
MVFLRHNCVFLALSWISFHLQLYMCVYTHTHTHTFVFPSGGSMLSLQCNDLELQNKTLVDKKFPKTRDRHARAPQQEGKAVHNVPDLNTKTRQNAAESPHNKENTPKLK